MSITPLIWHSNGNGIHYADKDTFHITVTRLLPSGGARFVIRSAAGGYPLASGTRPSTDEAMRIAEQITARMAGREIDPGSGAATANG